MAQTALEKGIGYRSARYSRRYLKNNNDSTGADYRGLNEEKGPERWAKGHNTGGNTRFSIVKRSVNSQSHDI